ncbi:molybdate ABC transporter ATP-binding protein ModF [Psychrobium sp. 1_MG-2023]|uniref:molybdate ABC transporter ATP-binding protein ModF n=1 Tax=Psychrobium sp. 1_MG-2023 TaxID=3062624 RepID=UPI002732F47A|nr:molybdate ABC transporter ATP-binding protein ModF [Psychrobium sp. 1_MG-2023]MDP2561841.1 molybdate ABC transporter ATP-binding protein ModF [Psychrobium sp. 1_MG-2023]
MNPLLQITDLHFDIDPQHQLSIDSLTINSGGSYLFCGDNASGKSLLVQLIAQDNSDVQGTITRPVKTSLVGFSVEDEILAIDRYFDRSEDIEGGIDWGRSAQDVIGHNEIAKQITEMLKIEPLLSKPFKVLSTGETRKVLLARALVQKPDLLILDEPYAGLDIASQQHLTDTLNTLISQGLSVIIVDFYHQDLPQNLTHFLLMASGKVVTQGLKQHVMETKLWQQANQQKVTLPHHLPDCHDYQHLDSDIAFVMMNNVSVSYEDNQVFNNFSWHFNSGQHWRLAGPNGCGKSTLLSLINGDNPKAYGKDIHLFGVKRGSGETVWDIKKHYGVVSAQLHRDYRAGVSVLGAVLSGFFDTIGLYDQPSEHQIDIAKQWLDLLQLSEQANKPFSQISYGEQRLVLIARAVVKLPLILILDEPCLGLDNQNRAQILALIDYITRHSNTHILFVSHDARDKLQCLTHQLDFIKEHKGYSIKQTQLAKDNDE